MNSQSRADIILCILCVTREQQSSKSICVSRKLPIKTARKIFLTCERTHDRSLLALRPLFTTMMFRIVLLCALVAVANGFVQSQSAIILRAPTTTSLNSRHQGTDEVVQQRAFPTGTFVEFQEKKRTHIGKIDSVEHKSTGGARYHILDSEGKKYDIADKAVLYGMSCPNSPGEASKLWQDFCRAQDAPENTLQAELDITPELLEMAWEEAAAEEEGDHLLTASSLIELVQGHAASAMETYLAWKLLKSETSHIFFKEIKDHGRVVAFKAKTRKAVDAAKEVFCKSHADSEICFVV